MSLPSIITTTHSAFLKAGYHERQLDRADAALSSLYSGHGMVWGVSVLPSFEDFRRRWCDSLDDVNAAVRALIQVSRPAEKWNLAVIVIVCEPLTDDMIPMVSEFQEDPASFARFVVALDSADSDPQLKDKISFLLLEWMDSSSLGAQTLPSVQGEIDAALAEAGAAIGGTSFNALSAAIASREPDPQAIASAALSDLKDVTPHETH